MRESPFYQLLAESIEKRISERVLKQGLEQGLEQGIEQGKIQEKHDSLIRLLQKRIGDVSDTVIHQIRAIQNTSDLDVLFDQAAEANSLKDVDLPND